VSPPCSPVMRTANVSHTAGHEQTASKEGRPSAPNAATATTPAAPPRKLTRKRELTLPRPSDLQSSQEETHDVAGIEIVGERTPLIPKITKDDMALPSPVPSLDR